MRKTKLPVWRVAVYAILLIVLALTIPTRVQEWVGSDKRWSPEFEFTHSKQTVLPDAPHQRYLLLYNAEDRIAETKATRDNLAMAMSYGKLPVDVMSFAEYRQLNTPLDQYAQGAIILVAEQQANLPHVENIKRYVTEQGGLLVNTIRSSDSPLNSFMGILGSVDFAPTAPTGLRWTEKIYPGLSEQTLSAERVTSSSLEVQLSSQVNVWAESVEPSGIPYLWRMEQGKGGVLYWNTLLLHESVMRGAFVQSMSKAQGDGAKATIGGQVWFIDDFPSPAYNRVSAGNLTGMTDYDFRLKRWDPDMQEIAKKYGVRYSAGTIFMYSDRVTPPFEVLHEGQQLLFDLEVKLIEDSGEIGLHGFNHQSLNLSYTPKEQELYGYTPWPSEQAMLQSLLAARNTWKAEIHSQLPTMYIPPSNVLSKEGKDQLLKAFPDLKTISSLYATSGKQGELAQEFLPDPDYPQVMGTPRATSGYSPEADELSDLYSLVATLGIVSHFNHPDDVFSDERGKGMTWDKLRDGFDRLVQDVNSRFSWLQPLTASELSDKLRLYHQTQVQIDRSQAGRLTAYLTPLKGPVYLEVRVAAPHDWDVKAGGKIVSRNEEYGLLWVEVTEPMLVLEVAK